MSKAKVEKIRRARPSVIWIVPFIAVTLGAWLVADSYFSQGPRVEVKFASAEGIVAGETLVKILSVELGVVEEVYLNEGYGDVTAVLQLDDGTEDLLHEDTQFWVVRPRVGTDGISGLSTLLSGAYIELAPGSGATGRVEFEGLEGIPITPITTPGLRVRLISTESSLLSTGSPVLYNGYQVGRVEESYLSLADGRRNYRLFINAPYHDLVNSNTRFWNAGGINFDAGADGVTLRVESLEALFSGGVSFGLPDGQDFGEPIESDHAFNLYPTFEAVHDQPFEYSNEYMLLFDSSVRGLVAGAPVEYRGIRVGTVMEVSFELVEDQSGFMVDGRALMPVLIRVDPGRLLNEDSVEANQELKAIIAEGVRNGLRGSLVSGNLLTGSLYVNMDFYDDAEYQEVQRVSGLDVFPTVSTELDQLQQQVTEVLAKFQNLPLEDALTSVSSALQVITTTVATADTTLLGVNELLQDPATLNLPGRADSVMSELSAAIDGIAPDSQLYRELAAALSDLRETLKNARELTAILEAQPSALIFSGTPKPDLIPGVTGQ